MLLLASSPCGGCSENDFTMRCAVVAPTTHVTQSNCSRLNLITRVMLGRHVQNILCKKHIHVSGQIVHKISCLYPNPISNPLEVG